MTVAPQYKADLPYDSRKDFLPLALVADTPMTLSVRTNSPFKTVDDYIKEAKAKPGKVTFATSGVGSVAHLTGELFSQAMGVKLLHVPYKGAAPAMTDLLSGQVASIITSAASIDPMIAADKARALASFTTERIPTLNGAPTMQEATGKKGLEVPVWAGFFAPLKTPPDQAARLSEALVAVCNAPATREKFKELGSMATCGDEGTERVFDGDYERWRQVFKAADIKIE